MLIKTKREAKYCIVFEKLSRMKKFGWPERSRVLYHMTGPDFIALAAKNPTPRGERRQPSYPVKEIRRVDALRKISIRH
jgi:hypothetical protein